MGKVSGALQLPSQQSMVSALVRAIASAARKGPNVPLGQVALRLADVAAVLIACTHEHIKLECATKARSSDWLAWREGGQQILMQYAWHFEATSGPCIRRRARYDHQPYQRFMEMGVGFVLPHVGRGYDPRLDAAGITPR